VIHPDDRERTLACWQAACRDEGEYDLEYRISRHDGEYRWFKTRGVPVRDDDGKIVYWFGTRTDIEDVKMAEKRERTLLEQTHFLMKEVNHRAKTCWPSSRLSRGILPSADRRIFSRASNSGFPRWRQARTC
jgi:PAS domain-containing protein